MVFWGVKTCTNTVGSLICPVSESTGSSSIVTQLYLVLEDKAGCAGPLLAPAENFGLQPRFFCPSGKNRAYCAVLSNFRPFLVSSNF